MKATLFSILFCLLAARVHASSPIFIDIANTASGPRYALNHVVKTLDQIERSLREDIEAFGGAPEEGIFIRPDAETSFATVFALLLRIKAARVWPFNVISPLPAPETSEHDVLVISRGSFTRRIVPAPPRSK